jgi:pentalenene oxygenase
VIGATSEESKAILAEIQGYGGLVGLMEGPPAVVMATDPAVVDEAARSLVLERPREEHPLVHRIFGRSLPTLPGEEGDRERRLIGPAFTKKLIGGYAAPIPDLCAKLTDQWQAGEVIEMKMAMREMTFKTAAHILIGVEREDQVEELWGVYRSMMDPQTSSVAQLYGAMLEHPADEEEKRVRFERDINRYDEIIFEVVADLRRREEHTPLIGRLMTIEGRSDRQLRDDIVSFLLTGVGITGTVMAYVLHCIAAHEGMQERLKAEMQNGGTREDAMSDFQAVVHETLRLYPPDWVFFRVCQQALVLGGLEMEAGTHVLVSPYVTQRSALYWASPLEWLPGRWQDGSLAGLPRYAFFPFGSGRRKCAGEALALQNMPLIMGEMLKRVRFGVDPDKPWVLERGDRETNSGVWLKVEAKL